ncbi:hypothetical protein CsSME_00003047 [Camellia sinensis var. sinensis]
MLHPGQNKQNIIWTLNRNRTGKEMDLESVKKYLERDGSRNATTIDEMPSKFFEPFVMQGLSIDLLEPGRLICSMIVPPRLLNTGNFLHGGATATLVDIVGSAVIYTVGAPFTGVSVEINVSYLDAAYVGEEIEIESKVLRVGKAIAVVSVELRKKKTGKIIAQGRHTKYLAVSSKM